MTETPGPKMSERDLYYEVTRICDQLELLWHHCADSRHCMGTPGLPDLIIAGPRGVIYAELKSADGETDADQDKWIWTLRRSTFPYPLMRMYIWTPADLESGEIRAQLLVLR